MVEEVVNLRVPTGTKARAGALLAIVALLPEVKRAATAAEAIGARTPRMSTSLVLRLALLRGLEQMEREATGDAKSSSRKE